MSITFLTTQTLSNMKHVEVNPKKKKAGFNNKQVLTIESDERQTTCNSLQDSRL